MSVCKKALAAAVLLWCVIGSAAQQPVVPKPEPVRYTISLTDAPNHVLHVRVMVPASQNSQTLRLPVWNALYQIRDFAQYVTNVAATDLNGRPVSIRTIDKSTWDVFAGGNDFAVSYDIVAALPGPYGADASLQHVFLNLAEVLMFVARTEHTAPVSLQFSDAPAKWSIATILQHDALEPDTWLAPSYDALVDAPVELGKFREMGFQEGSTKYRIVIDADSTFYDAVAIEQSVRRIVQTEVAWMDDQPCPEYLFIYHFPSSGSGGMEHACSAAIDVPGRRMTDMSALESVTAHEFFHQWNVKRIRPQSLEPIDYSKEQYTRALWFSEGVTSTVEGYVLLQAGLLGSEEYLRDLSYEIDTLQQRPAHKTQSAEESSIDAWLEKYSFYRRPERSISYYNKGEILGVMLDLAVRDATGGTKSLRDVFRWMNNNYGKKRLFFSDTEGVRTAVDAVTGGEFRQFFDNYVAGTHELPYDRFLNTAGLCLAEQRVIEADIGFTVSRNFDGRPTILMVQIGSEAERAGLKEGDEFLAINGKTDAVVDQELATVSPGDIVRIRVLSESKEREIKLKARSREVSHFTIVDVDHPNQAQLLRRSEWLGEAARAASAGDAKQ